MPASLFLLFYFALLSTIAAFPSESKLIFGVCLLLKLISK